MKRLLAALAVAIIAFASSSCAGSSTSESPATPPLSSSASNGGAVPAHADPDRDAKFIQGLDTGNVPYKNPQNAVLLAHVVCTDFRRGYTYLYTVNMVSQMNPDWTDFQNGFFVGLSVPAYCPDQSDKIPTSH
jgi:hypothetical protein